MKKKDRLKEIRIEPSELDLKQPLGRFLIVLFRQFENELLLELERIGYKSLSSADFNAIRNIDPKGSSSIRIAQLAGISKQAMSKQLSKIEKQGLIKRKPDSVDSRSQQIVFTKKGEQLVVAAIGIIQKIENRYARYLGGVDQLTKMKEHLGGLSLSHGEL